MIISCTLLRIRIQNPIYHDSKEVLPIAINVNIDAIRQWNQCTPASISLQNILISEWSEKQKEKIFLLFVYKEFEREASYDRIWR